jgi:Tfp pilus assembly protein PilO
MQWVAAGLLVASLGGFYVLGYRPRQSQLRDLESQIASKRRELEANQAKVLELPRLILKVEKLQARVERNGKKLPRQLELGRFMNDLTQVGQQTMLRNFTVMPMGSRRMELFFEQPICLNFEGDFLQAAMFLRQVEDMQRLTRVRRLHIRNRDDKSGQVEVEVTMNIYFSEG